jgi:hypothetical protein
MIGMNSIEEIAYAAWNVGKRDELFRIIGEIRKKSPNKPIKDLYEEAWTQIISK